MKTAIPPQPTAAAQAVPVSPTPAPFEPVVVPTPEPNTLAELNETRRRLETAERLLRKSTVEIEKLTAYVRKIEENPLIMVLSTLDAGTVLAEAGTELKVVTAAVRKLQAAGTFTMTLKIKPFKGDALVFLPNVKSKPPLPEIAPGVFYSSDDGSLSRSDKRQPELNLGGSRADRSDPGDRDPYADERAAAAVVETSEEELRQAQKVADEMDEFPTVSNLQRKLNWGYSQAARVHEALRAVTR